jgi:anaerobic selenocysteine-containing dehydrogenase
MMDDSSKITRRTMLRFLGAAGVWTLFGCSKYPGPLQVQLVPAGWHRGEERYILSTCLQCPGGCGINVRVYEGRAIKIEGNPDHPLNQGGLCPKGQAGLQALYDPDRIPGPMRKIGDRSSLNWEAISWDEAIDTLARKLRQLREAGKPESLLLMGDRFPGHMKALFERFASAYGTPNMVDIESINNYEKRLAMFLTQGIHDLPGYNLADTRFLLLFGAGFLESWQPAGYTLRMYGESRLTQAGTRSKIVVVDPHCGVGASKADEWIPIRPGTYAALALSMAYVIIKEDLYDHTFIEEHAFGFEDWEEETEHGSSYEGFKTMVLREYPPERGEKLTGIPAPVIRRLAREFTKAQPAVAAVGRGPELHTNGLLANMAIHSLNGLVGSIDVPGGVIVQESPPFKSWHDAILDERARVGITQSPLAVRGPGIEGLPASGAHDKLIDSILSDKPYPVEVAVVYNANPLFSGPDTARYQQAFDSIPFVVSFSSFMDETTARADLVLPDSTYLERLEDDFVLPSVGFPVVNLRRPVMEPIHETRHTGDILIELAKQIGGTVGSSFPWKSYEEALKETVAGIAAAGTGSFTGRNAEDFWTTLKERGTWSGDPYRFESWERVFRTSTGKFEFFPLAWKQHLETESRRTGKTIDAILDGFGIQARGDTALMPHYEPPRFAGDPERFPLHLQTYKTMMHAEGRGGNQPWLQESFGVQLSERWRPWAEINPTTAEALGIRDGDPVWVESERGRLRFIARFHPGLRPDVVNIPIGYGHTSFGRWAKGRGGNPNDIISSLVDLATGTHAIHATNVRVYSAVAGREQPQKTKGSILAAMGNGH